MAHKYILFLLFAGISLLATGQKTAPFTIGESVTFTSNILKEERTINVYLPASYNAEEAASYPVIYLLDGSADEDFIHIAGLVQFSTFSWAQLIPESIVVGVANVDRKRDFTFPTTLERDKKDFPTTGGSAAFIDFIENELQPLVSKKYRVTDDRMLIGQSLGGLLATEVLWKKPALFSKYIIVSPSLWWDDESVIALDRVPATEGTKVAVVVGQEGPIMERGAMLLSASLKADRNLDSSFTYLGSLDHANILHTAVYEAFKKLYAPEKKKENK